jgi:PAS domain-containing protein
MQKPLIYRIGLITYPVSSILVVLLLWRQVPYTTIEQLIGIAVIILLVSLNRQLFRPEAKNSLVQMASLGLYLLAAFLVQLVVATTGGIQSPFLILLHLMTLSLGLLLGLPASLVFLASAVSLLGALFIIDPDTRDLFQADPGTTLMYIASLVAIAPITQIISHHYHLQDRLTKAFAEQAQAASNLLDSLHQLVVVTDKNYLILSANNAVGELLHQPVNTLVHQPLSSLLFLKDKTGSLLTLPDAASLHKPTEIHQLHLLVKNSIRPYMVTVTITPLTQINGQVEQIGVVIEDAQHPQGQADQQLDMLYAKQRALLESLQSHLIQRQIMDLAAYVEVAKKVDRDAALLKALQQPIEPQTALVDVAQLLRNVVAQEQPLAQALAATVGFSILNYNQQEAQQLIVGELNLSPMDVTGAFFTAPINTSWFTYFIQEVLDVLILLVSGTPQPCVEVLLDRQAETTLVITLRAVNSSLTTDLLPQLFTQQYGSLNVPNLRLSSGMEGYLASTIAQQLGLAMTVTHDQAAQSLQVSIVLPK